MRKKWEAKTEITPSLLKFREKRKWQISLRRYVLDKAKCYYYAPFFGLDNTSFREWIELQFDETLSWENFSTAWQFDHIVPVNYFDFNIVDDMKLCWNFINIRVEKCDLNKGRGNRIDVIAAKTYFEVLYKETGLGICQKMIEKISSIEVSQISSHQKLESFILKEKKFLDMASSLTADEFEKINMGVSMEEIESEKALLKKFG
jgi:hypothetical protein